MNTSAFRDRATSNCSKVAVPIAAIVFAAACGSEPASPSTESCAAADCAQVAGAGGGVTGAAGTGGVAGDHQPNTSGAAGQTGGAAGIGGAAGGAGAAGAANTAPTFHVFVLLGQSNMAGNPPAQDSDKIEDERVLVLGFDDCAATGRRANEWDVASPPLHECWAKAVGPGDYFAKTLIQKLPEADTIGLVPCALSGQSVDVFSKGTDKYDWIVQRVNAAKRMGGVIQGFLFHQGESDCQNRTWPTRVQRLATDLKADLGLTDIPFLVGELPYGGQCSAHNELVRQLPALIPNAHVVSAEGLAVRDIWHFDHDSVIELGKRYEATLAKVWTW